MSRKDVDTARYEVITHEDPETGDLILPLPHELLDKMGWVEGDKIQWSQDTNGTWVLSKASS